MLSLVRPEDIPDKTNIIDTPTDDLLKIYKIALQMENLCEKEGGVGLSAVQVGLPWKFFVIKSNGKMDFAPKNQYGYFINCEYEPTTNAQRIISLEGCLSLRSSEGRLRHFQIERWSEIRVLGSRLIVEKNSFLKKYENLIYSEEYSIIMQHEIDHNNGILISEIGQEILIWK